MQSKDQKQTDEANKISFMNTDTNIVHTDDVMSNKNVN